MDGDRVSGEGRSGALGTYVPSLDGLRGVAMVVMLAYHAQLPIGKGAFLGLSQFFTLSGFLITAVLLRRVDRPTGIALRGFWTRRFRRLMPAALLTLVGVVLFGATVADATQLDDLTGQLLAALFYVANWFFIFSQQSYVDLFASPSPVQHFWSLAVEEQFYLLLPLGLALFFRRSRSLVLLACIMGALALASTMAMVVLYRSGAGLDRIYYGTDTRAAELLVGSVLAVMLHHRPLVPGHVVTTRVLPAAGLVAFAVSWWGILTVPLADGPIWSGGMLAFSCLSALVIAALLTGHGPLPVVLSWAPFALAGRLTYGLYLFHWPIFLWLTPERTGLDLWPLFGVRVAVTGALALASYHLIELPILNGTFRAPFRARSFVLAPAVVVLVVVGAVVVPLVREAPNPLETLAEPAAAMPVLPLGGADGVLDLVVVYDDAGEDLSAEIDRLADERDDLRIGRTLSFDCPGPDAGPVDPRAACGGWRDWRAAVAEERPEAVLLLVRTWSNEDVAEASGLPATDTPAMTEWAREALGAGIDALGSDGAVVVWHRPVASDMASALRERDVAFRGAMDGLLGSHPNLYRPTEQLATWSVELNQVPLAELLLTEVSNYTRLDEGIPKVMVVGDSIATSMTWGLSRWADEVGVAVIWSNATPGCGVANEGVYRTTAGLEIGIPDDCLAVEEGWRRAVATFDPDIVLVHSGTWDVAPRRLEQWSEHLRPGDAAFDDYLFDEYVRAVDVLGAGGAEVRWLAPVCTEAVNLGANLEGRAVLVEGAGPEGAPWIRDELLPRVTAARPEAMSVFDFYSIVCPKGEYEPDLGGVTGARPDGVHFSTEAALWLAREHGLEILGLE